MAFAQILIFIAIGLSASILFVKDRTTAVLFYGSVSAIAVVIFSLYAAPDVALAEASIGLVFTLFLYMVTLQHKGKLWVGLAEVDKSIDALEIEILGHYCELHDLTLKIVKIEEESILDHIRSGKVEIAAAAFLNSLEMDDVKMTIGFLETKVLFFGEPENKLVFKKKEDLEKAIRDYQLGKIKGVSIDLIRYLDLSFKNVNGELPSPTSEEKGFSYAFGVVADEADLLRSFNDYLKEIKENGQLQKMIERYMR